MATYKGHDAPNYEPTDVSGPPLPGMENVEEELNLPPEAGTERTRRPGEKGYMKERHMAGTPTPKVRGNLPSMDESKSDAEGREVPAPPMQFYERGQVTSNGTTTFRHGPFEPPPTPIRGRGMTPDEIAKFREGDEALGYRQGGSVRKYGSDTVVSCKHKNQ